MLIVHHIPGRLRLRVPPSVGGDDLVESLQRVDGVRSCAWSPLTRSVLVLYDADPATAAAIADAAGGNGHAPPTRRAPAPARTATPITLARAVTDAFAEVDGRIRRTTSGLLGLGGLVPLALTLWAVRELAIGRAAPLVWSSALWYAHGLFRDYNSPPPP